MKNAVSILSAIAHEGRLGLFRQLVKAGADGLAVGELAQLARANITTVSAQLSVLDHAGLVDRRRDGRSIIYTANYQRASALLAFMMDNCCQGRAEIVGPLAHIKDNANRD
ncbi:MAG: metalloregulator ArsR/SmtB family transcription factor [Woeseiaceae bacterium]|jgi:DNA-binding transcriptional ArsR family regulator